MTESFDFLQTETWPFELIVKSALERKECLEKLREQCDIRFKIVSDQRNIVLNATKD